MDNEDLKYAVEALTDQVRTLEETINLLREQIADLTKALKKR